MSRAVVTIDGSPQLTPKQETFVRLYVETGNGGVSYRAAYNVGDTTRPDTVWKEAHLLLQLPHIKARIAELYQLAVTGRITTIREIAQDWHDIATANPNELTWIEAVNCRYCRGQEHHYQWASELEYERKAIETIANKQQLPDATGGLGFDGNLKPVPHCPHCFGNGIPRTRFADSRELTGKARKLFAGVKQKASGEIEILMHDQHAARDALARMAGAYKDAVPLAPPEAAPPIDVAASAEEAEQAYLALVKS